MTTLAHEPRRVVPAYALTGGRTRSNGRDIPIESLVTITELAAYRSADLQVEQQEILELGARPVSIAEIAAALRVPIGVARVLVGDMANTGYLTVHLPMTESDGHPSVHVLERVLDGLRAL